MATTAVYAWAPVGNPAFSQSGTECPIGKTNQELAHAAGVSEKTIKQAKAVQTRAAPEAVETLLKDGEWAKWSDRQIAKACGVSNDFASRLRKSSLSSDDSEQTVERTYTTKHGTTAVMKTENIGGVPCMRETAKWTPLAGSGSAPPGSGKGAVKHHPLSAKVVDHSRKLQFMERG